MDSQVGLVSVVTPDPVLSSEYMDWREVHMAQPYIPELGTTQPQHAFKGPHMVLAGPLLGQYHPKLKPLMKARPLPQLFTSR